MDEPAELDLRDIRNFIDAMAEAGLLGRSKFNRVLRVLVASIGLYGAGRQPDFDILEQWCGIYIRLGAGDLPGVDPAGCRRSKLLLDQPPDKCRRGAGLCRCGLLCAQLSERDGLHPACAIHVQRVPDRVTKSSHAFRIA